MVLRIHGCSARRAATIQSTLEKFIERLLKSRGKNSRREMIMDKYSKRLIFLLFILISLMIIDQTLSIVAKLI